MTTEIEIGALHTVYLDAIHRQPEYLDTVDVIIAGDMNADCTYVQDPYELWLYSFGSFLFRF